MTMKVVLLVAAFCLQSALVRAWARTCSLEQEGVQFVMVRPGASDDVGHGRTLGLKANGRERAVLVAKKNTERKLGEDNGVHNATVSPDLASASFNGTDDASTSDRPAADDALVPFEGRPCNW